jgi:hypothetical protein
MFFSKVRIPKRRLPPYPIVEQEKGIAKEKHREANMGVESIIKSKFLSHFSKGKISLSPMETILIISRELEYLEGLVKLARRRKDVEGQKN